MLGCVALGMVAWYFGIYQPMEKKKAENREQRFQKRMQEKEAILLRKEGEVPGIDPELRAKMDSVNVAADSLQFLLDSFSRRHPNADSMMNLMGEQE